MNPPRRLTGPELKPFIDALFSAYDTFKLTTMLSTRLDKRLDTYAAPFLSFDTQVFNLVTGTVAEGNNPFWRLVDAARRDRPEHEGLARFAEKYRLSPVASALEQLVVPALQFLTPTVLRKQIAAIEAQVCQIVVTAPAGTRYGTGFLVARDLILTNQHVIAGEPNAASIKVRFDYKELANGSTYDGTWCPVAANWLVVCSPPSPLDEHPDGQNWPTNECLDYALVRLEKPMGDEPPPAFDQSSPQAPSRSWLKLSNVKPVPASPLLIVQHPQGAPLKLALDTNSITEVKETRVRYNTNTEHGSSGSPCFDLQWNLIALHHTGDPSEPKPAWNEGIPCAAILADLAAKGKAALLPA
jgi:hypothetical protein